MLSSSEFEKTLVFNYCNGRDQKNEHNKSMNFSVQKGKNWFILKDYFKFKDIDQKQGEYFQSTGTEETVNVIEKFIEQIVFLLKQDDIQHILTSNDWIDIPHDKSMYF